MLAAAQQAQSRAQAARSRGHDAPLRQRPLAEIDRNLALPDRGLGLVKANAYAMCMFDQSSSFNSKKQVAELRY